MTRLRCCWLLGSLACVSAVHATDLDLDSVLTEMKEAGANYNPQPLYQLGARALTTVLDRLLPESASVATEPVAPPTELLRQLGDKDYRVREAATQKLIALGPAVRPYLETATRDRDPEVAARAEAALEKIPRPPAATDRPQDTGRRLGASYGEAFRVFAEGLTDKPSLRVLALRSLAALQAGRPAPQIPQDILQNALIAVARRGDDELLNTLEPVLALETEATVVWVVRTIGGNLPGKVVPQLLAKARQSNRPAIAREADLWLRPAGPNAQPFHVANLTDKFFALVGDYRGRFEVVDDRLIVWLDEGKIARIKPGGRSSVDRLRAGLATQTKGERWNVPLRSNNALPLAQFIEDGKELPLAPTRFVFPLEGRLLEEHWLLFQIESHSPDRPDVKMRRVTGHSYAHSARDIFQRPPPAKPAPPAVEN